MRLSFLDSEEHMATFRALNSTMSFPQLELEILEQWRSKRVFERSVEQRSATDRFVFYDGPPFATGLPHYGHLVASTHAEAIAWLTPGKSVPTKRASS